MIFEIDRVEYALDVKHIMNHLKMVYDQKKHTTTIPLENGTTIDIGRKSILRLALKSLMVPFALPVLRMIYKKKGLELDKPVKHTDLIDYIVEHMLTYISLVEGDLYVYISTQVVDSGVKNIKAISTTRYQPDTGANRANLTQNTDESNRRGDVLCSGKNGYGENTFDQGIDTQETINPAI